MGEGSLPCPWHWLLGRNVSRDISAREEPDADSTLDPLHRVDATAVVVEVITVAVIVVDVQESTAGVITVDHSTVGVENLAGRWVTRVRLD